jgi:hypothetical protein
MSKIEINLKSGLGTICIDGVPVKGVCGFEVKAHVDQVTTVALTIMPSEIVITEDDAVITTGPDNTVFRRRKG